MPKTNVARAHNDVEILSMNDAMHELGSCITGDAAGRKK
jgi:hypothetical protein